MKTPEEIKKGLALCVNANPCNYPCEECPYENEEDGCKSMMEDALALIQQLEAQNAELVKQVERLKADKKKIMETANILSDAVTRLERERDAAIADLAKTSDRCRYCKHNELYTTVCDECVHGMNFEWRGVPEPPAEEADHV